MSLPEFTVRGLLPIGVHYASPRDLEERCVVPFPLSIRRLLVFDSFIRYREELANTGINAVQWVDGSFVDQTRMNPNDIDAANFCDSANLNALPLEQHARVTQLLNGNRRTHIEFCTHAFLIVYFPSGHPLAARYEGLRRYWRTWFAQPQDYSGPTKIPAPWRGSKGIVRMYIGDDRVCPVVSEDI